MSWGWCRRADRAAVKNFRSYSVLAVACAIALAGCTTDGQPAASVSGPHGASVAFESINGPPPAQFSKLVQDLNDEAQARRLAVISRESPSAYRVRGYIATKVTKDHITVSWVWDVYDNDEHRALRITGEEIAKGRHRDAWAAADDEMLERIAGTSMDQLAAFLTSPEVAPGTAVASGEPQLVLTGQHDSTPESAGIFRIFQANADPTPVNTTDTSETASDVPKSVPLPRRRPPMASVVSTVPEPLTVAAISR
jgi:hypothetical protein